MRLEGGCYCGAVRYVAEGEPVLKGLCYCRECQHVSGGGPNHFISMPLAGLSYPKGAPKSYTRSDIANPVTRDFCPDCGTHLVTRRTDFGIAVVKIGTLDDPSTFAPRVAIYTADIQPFHAAPEGLPAFEALPPRRG